MASESQKVEGLLARVLPVHEGSGHPGPRPDRDARGPRQWPFHSARPGPKGPARVRGGAAPESHLSSAIGLAEA